MGIIRFIRHLNCFGSNKGRRNSRKQLERELSCVNASISAMEEKIETTRWVIEECKQQRLAEEREQITIDTRSHLMAQVEQIEIELSEALKHRQMAMTDIVEIGLRKTALEKTVKALDKRLNFFWMDIYQTDPDPRKTAKKRRENLRQLRSQNDIHKAVLQPSLFPFLELEEETFWFDRRLSSEEMMNEMCQGGENVSEIVATYL